MSLQMVPMPEFHSAPVEVDAANRAEDVRNQLLSLRRLVDKSFLTMGAYMKEVRDKKYYKHFGCRNLEEFCYQQLNYGARQVRSFVSVYEKFVEKLQIDERRLLEVGSTKLATMAEVVDGKNIDEWLDYAEKNNVPNVSNRVAETLGNDNLNEIEEQQAVASLWQVRLTPAQRTFINETIELAKQSNGSDWEGAALEGICADFQAGLEHDASRVILSFPVTRQEQNIIGMAIDWGKENGFQNVGALLAAAVDRLIEQKE